MASCFALLGLRTCGILLHIPDVKPLATKQTSVENRCKCTPYPRSSISGIRTIPTPPMSVNQWTSVLSLFFFWKIFSEFSALLLCCDNLLIDIICLCKIISFYRDWRMLVEGYPFVGLGIVWLIERDMNPFHYIIIKGRAVFAVAHFFFVLLSF